MIDFGLDIQEALAMPRWLSGRFALGEARDTLHIEGRFPRETIDELAAARPRHQPLGRLERNGRSRPWHHHRPASGMLSGGFDPRSDGAAIGY